MMWAASEKNAVAAKLLIERGAIVNAKTNPLPPPRKLDLIFSAPTPAGGMAAILSAARQNDLASVKVLLDGGADVNLTSADGSTALLVAIINEHNELAEYLLEHGADANLADDKGRAGLYVAIDMRDLEWSTRPAPPGKDKGDGLQLIRALLQRGAKPNGRLGERVPLRGEAACEGGWAVRMKRGGKEYWPVEVLFKNAGIQRDGMCTRMSAG